IKNVAVIEELNIDFFKGLSVLTGETGAGKSIIIDSIGLLKGDRGSKSIIRSGEEKARVDGVFDADMETAQKIADILGTEPEEEIIISRQISADGKNTVRINGVPANINMLREIGSYLVNIHGQHDNVSLLQPKNHIEFLDSFGKEEISPALMEYKSYFAKCAELSDKISAIDTDDREKLRRKDMLQFQIAELDEASLEIGEDESLMARKSVLDNSQKICENTRRAYDAIYGSDSGTSYDSLWEAINLLEKITGFDDEIDSVYDALSDAADVINEKARELRRINDSLSFDSEESDAIEERLELISTLKRKYGKTIEEITEFHQRARSELEEIETSDERLASLKEELEKNKKILKEKAEKLSLLRKKYAADLSEKIMAELSELNMEKVQFGIQFAAQESFKSNGCDAVEFTVRTNVGEEAKPLAKIASGGELSRIMLAIKSVLKNSDPIDTSVFDEIDTGVSGAAAQKIGEKLKKMAGNSLVLCITHLPQIAALADNHYLITKSVEDGRTHTKLKLLDFDQRVDEIARTLGGATVTDITRENARQLLKNK
ncbi:MAG: DNA repair protein RecN, partial [Clostridia bacterium]|nr:DNA repair protein RecN [Clostridia bacterium]